MYLRLNAGDNTLAVAAATLPDENLPIISVDGSFIAFDFKWLTQPQACELVRNMSAYLAEAAAMTDVIEVSAGLEAIRATLLRAYQEYLRENASYNDVAPNAEAIEAADVSQLHANRNASTTESPESNGATPNDEENVTNGKTQQGPRRRK